MVEITDEAVTAAVNAWRATPLFHGQVATDTPRAMRAALKAALPHLADTGLPPTLSTDDVEALGRQGATYLEDRFDRIERLLHDQWVHRFDTGQPLAELVTAKGPTDYEVWRDALGLAVSEGAHIDEDGVSSRTLLARARWFRSRLMLGPAPQDDENERPAQ